MEPLSAAACFTVIGKGAIVVLGAAEAALMGGFATFTAQEGIRYATRNPDDWHDFKNARQKLVRLQTTSLVKELASLVLQKYHPTSSAWNWLGTGTSKSSGALYTNLKATNDTTRQFTLLNEYLADKNNNGKTMHILLKDYISKYPG